MTRFAAVALAAIGLLGLGFKADTDDITIHAYPGVVTFDQRVIVSGELTPAKADEYVAVQGKECGLPGAFFRSLWGASTNEGGGWEAEFYVRTKTALRAVSGNDVSPELTVLVRVPVHLSPMPGRPGRFRIAVAWGTTVSFRGKRVVVQRFDPSARKWRSVRSFEIDDDRTVENFRIPVSKRTTVRAYVPASQAKPCYLAGFSKLIRT
jgi:hypothetical protein